MPLSATNKENKMYLLPDMIDMGLKDGERFKSEDHRTVCINIVIGRPGLDHLDQMVDVVSAVNAIPTNRIKTVTLEDCKKEFNVPFID